jgi:hypothetical protein
MKTPEVKGWGDRARDGRFFDLHRYTARRVPLYLSRLTVVTGIQGL